MPVYDLADIQAEKPILASTIVAIGGKLQAHMREQAFTSSGIFTVPDYVDRIKVGLCSWGGALQGLKDTDGFGGLEAWEYEIPGIDSTWAVKYIDVEPGQSIAVTITESATTFGSVLSSSAIENFISGDIHRSNQATSAGQDYRGICPRFERVVSSVMNFKWNRRYGQGVIGKYFEDDPGPGGPLCVVEW